MILGFPTTPSEDGSRNSLKGVVTGRYDVIALIMLNNDNDLLKSHTKEMPKIKDITFTETFIMYKNVNWKVPYVF